MLRRTIAAVCLLAGVVGLPGYPLSARGALGYAVSGIDVPGSTDIAAAATAILGGIDSANAAFLEGRREGSPICTRFP